MALLNKVHGDLSPRLEETTTGGDDFGGRLCGRGILVADDAYGKLRDDGWQGGDPVNRET